MTGDPTLNDAARAELAATSRAGTPAPAAADDLRALFSLTSRRLIQLIAPADVTEIVLDTVRDVRVERTGMGFAQLHLATEHGTVIELMAAGANRRRRRRDLRCLTLPDWRCVGPAAARPSLLPLFWPIACAIMRGPTFRPVAVRHGLLARPMRSGALSVFVPDDGCLNTFNIERECDTAAGPRLRARSKSDGVERVRFAGV
ncbi:MAG: hypothetical protein M3116_01180 [Actinomycetota bacterium]|nr:hypothetical protein [Actinomycetota bacterium]